jgi:transposase
MPKGQLSEVQRLRQVNSNLKTQNAKLRLRVAELEAVVAVQAATIEKLQIQIAELQAMIFGKKKPPRPPASGSDSGCSDDIQPKQPRSKNSYHRPVPPPEVVTSTIQIPAGVCACGGELVSIAIRDRYIEDIPLPELTVGYMPKLVVKYEVERGTYSRCSKTVCSMNLGGAVVSLGSNVRLLVCRLVSEVGLTYSQVAGLLLTLYNLRVSDGELAGIITKQHRKWLPDYEQLKEDIREAPVVHADESPWPIQKVGGGYGWVLCDAASPKVCFSLVDSRGGGHAADLFGSSFNGVRISDNYGVYRSLPGKQQLCWVHLYRVIRDLKNNANLPEGQLPYVTQWYKEFNAIYQDLRSYLAQSYDLETRSHQATELWSRLHPLLKLQPDEPDKLTKLKNQLLKAGQERLFLCLVADTPCDNNRAERDIRGLVLKRKRSFGSKTEKGARALATVMSICTTTRRLNPTSYFTALAAVGV